MLDLLPRALVHELGDAHAMTFVRVALVAQEAQAALRKKQPLQLIELLACAGRLDVLPVDSPELLEIARACGLGAFGGRAELLEMQVLDALLIEAGRQHLLGESGAA